MKEIRLATKIVKTLVKDHIHYPNRLVLDTIGIIARCGILLLLYSYVYKLNGGNINGTTFLFAAWSLFFYFTFSILRLRGIARLIMQDIQSGYVEILFSKPISYIFYRIWWQIGSGIYSFIIITLLAGVALTLTIGLPSTMLTGLFIPTLIITLILASVLSLFIYLIIGLMAFWIEDINPVFWVVDKTVMILGGSYLPVALFPVLMYKMALYSPFGASQFMTHTVNPIWQNNWYQLIGIQLFWVAVLGFVIYFMFEKAKQKISVNGG